MTHILDRMEWDGMRFHHPTQNEVQFKICELFTPGIFHLIFVDMIVSNWNYRRQNWGVGETTQWLECGATRSLERKRQVFCLGSVFHWVSSCDVFYCLPPSPKQFNSPVNVSKSLLASLHVLQSTPWCPHIHIWAYLPRGFLGILCALSMKHAPSVICRDCLIALRPGRVYLSVDCHSRWWAH
jgi:hypothetical protein